MNILVVDKNDTVIGFKERSKLMPGDIYRVSALWLTNSKGEVLMAKRSKTKLKNPNVWGPAVAGTVEADESYEQNIIKETQEEIGLLLTLADLSLGPKMYISRNEANDWYLQWYLVTRDVAIESLTIQKDEVASLAWFGARELRERVSKFPEEFTPSANQWAQFLEEKI